MSEFETWTKAAYELEAGDTIIRGQRQFRVFEVELGEGVTCQVQNTVTDTISTFKFGIGDDVLILNQ